MKVAHRRRRAPRGDQLEPVRRLRPKTWSPRIIDLRARACVSVCVCGVGHKTERTCAGKNKNTPRKTGFPPKSPSPSEWWWPSSSTWMWNPTRGHMYRTRSPPGRGGRGVPRGADQGTREATHYLPLSFYNPVSLRKTRKLKRRTKHELSSPRSRSSASSSEIFTLCRELRVAAAV